jgi:hypothetical protein
LVVSAESLVEVEPDVDLTLPSDPDGLEQVEEPGSVSGQDDPGAPFQIIPNFSVFQGGQERKVGSRLECQDLCLQTAAACESVSYRARDRKCLVSLVKLAIKHGWEFHMKIKLMNDVGLMKPTGKYRKFDNMLFDDPKYMKRTADVDTCKQLCSDDDNCGSFSFQQKTQTCQPGGPGVAFDPEYTYYERNKSEEKLPEKSGDHESDLPETAEEEGDSVKAKKSIHIVPPEVQSLNAQLAKQAEEIRQMSMSIKNNQLDPRFSVDPVKEKQGKDVVKKEEEEQMMMFGLKQQAQKNILAIQKTTTQVNREARGVTKEGQSKALTLAKGAFVEGERAAERRGLGEYNIEVGKLKNQLKAAGGAEAGENPVVRRKEKRQKYLQKERLDMVKRKGAMRAKELTIKHKKRDEALALSRKVFHLVNDERDTKLAKVRTLELAGKANKAANTKTIVEAMNERNEEKKEQLISSFAQEKKDMSFELAVLGDKSKQIQEDLQLKAQQRKVQAALKTEQEGREKLKEAASGAKERGTKDEKKGAENERAQKDANMPR